MLSCIDNLYRVDFNAIATKSSKIVNVIFLGFCWYTPLLLLTSFMSLGWQVWIIYRCQSNYEEISMLIKIRKLTVYQRVKLGIKLDLLNIVLAFCHNF